MSTHQHTVMISFNAISQVPQELVCLVSDLLEDNIVLMFHSGPHLSSIQNVMGKRVVRIEPEVRVCRRKIQPRT